MMKHNPSSVNAGDDDPVDRQPKTRLESRLGKLKPKGVNFNADSLMRAAKQTDSAEENVVTRVSLPAATTPAFPVKSISISWVCGVAMGALLMLTWFDSAKPDAISTETVVASTNKTIADSRDAQPGIVTSEPSWSRSERLVAAQLRELGSADSYNGWPSMAGNYVRLQSYRDRVPQNPGPVGYSSVDSKSNWASDVSLSGSSTSIKADQLLQELLGMGPGSKL